MERLFTGLDVGSTSCHVVAMDDQGKVSLDRKIQTSPQRLVETFQRLKGEVWVHLEASAMAGWIRRALKGHVHRIQVSHPKANAWIAKDPLKRDEIDAYKLAELQRMNRVHEVYYPEDDRRGLFKRLVQHYEDVTESQARLKIKIKARLLAEGILSEGQGLFEKGGRLNVLSQVKTPAIRIMIEQLYAMLDEAIRQQKAALREVGKAGKEFPEFARLQTMPGVGAVSAAKFIAYIQDPLRFAKRTKLWRYCGLGVTNRSSDGKPLGRRCLDRSGNGILKTVSRVIFNGALRSRQDNRFKRAYHESLERTHDKTHARLNVQRKILLTLWVMWKTQSEYQDDKS